MSEAMRYITIPKAVTIIDQQVNRLTGELKTSGEKEYSYFDLLDDHVWARSEWRKDETHAAAWNRLVEAHDDAKENHLPIVACTAEDFAIFKKFATLEDVQIAGPNVKKITRLTQAVLFASSKKPESVKEEVKPNGVTTTTSEAAS